MRVKVSQMRDDKESWKESESRPWCCDYRLIYSSRLFYSNSSPLKSDARSSFDDYFELNPCYYRYYIKLPVLRWGGLWCFWVNTSSELFGCWSCGAIRPLSVNPTSQKQLSHTHSCRNCTDYGLRYNWAHSVCWKVSDLVVPGPSHTHADVHVHTHIRARSKNVSLLAGGRVTVWKYRAELKWWLDKPRCEKGYSSVYYSMCCSFIVAANTILNIHIAYFCCYNTTFIKIQILQMKLT